MEKFLNNDRLFEDHRRFVIRDKKTFPLLGLEKGLEKQSWKTSLLFNLIITRDPREIF